MTSLHQPKIERPKMQVLPSLVANPLIAVLENKNLTLETAQIQVKEYLLAEYISVLQAINTPKFLKTIEDTFLAQKFAISLFKYILQHNVFTISSISLSDSVLTCTCSEFVDYIQKDDFIKVKITFRVLKNKGLCIEFKNDYDSYSGGSEHEKMHFELYIARAKNKKPNGQKVIKTLDHHGRKKKFQEIATIDFEDDLYMVFCHNHVAQDTKVQKKKTRNRY